MLDLKSYLPSLQPAWGWSCRVARLGGNGECGSTGRAGRHSQGDSRALVYASLFYFIAGVVAEYLGVTQAQDVPGGK